MEDAVHSEALLQHATRTFQECVGYAATLFAPVVLKDSARSRVVRCQVASAESRISSVILKQIKDDEARGFSDWASLAFLSTLPEAQGIVPRFYGGSIAHRLFLMEDLGAGESLQDILLTGTRHAAQAALQALALQMARLHHASAERYEVFQTLRSALHAATGLDRHAEARSWADHRKKILDWFKAVEYVAPSGFDVCLAHIATTYSQPDGFLGFTHGDPAPSNNHFSQGQARLVDFEYGDFRHILYDITAWHILCPLPLDCVDAMRAVFCEEIGKHYPAAGNKSQFAEAWACLCAYRALAILTWIPLTILKEDRPWADTWTMRAAVLTAISRLEHITAPFAQLEALSEAAGVLANALHSRWPEYARIEDGLPQWPALIDCNQT